VTKVNENFVRFRAAAHPVCICGRETHRPGASQNEFRRSKRPDQHYCFAGVDKDAVDAARQHMFSFPSPSYGLIQNGELVHMERHHIEGRPAELIAENLQDAYNEHC
jgi:putative YphP/YqiW family bacilliredoxin